MPGHRTAATTGPVHAGPASSATMARVWQRHSRAVRVRHNRLRGVMRQSRARSLNAPEIVVLGERGHAHIGRPAKGFLTQQRRFLELGSGGLPPDDDGRLVRVLQDDSRTAGDDCSRVHLAVVDRRVIDVLAAARVVSRRVGDNAAGVASRTLRHQQSVAVR